MRLPQPATARYSFQFFLLVSLFIPVTQALAEKADSQKTAYISAEQNVSDLKTNTTTFSGNVELTRGTLTVHAARAVVTESAEKAGTFVLFGEAGTPVSFRQKRDGGPDLWLEGSADRVEYNDKSEIVKFISKAKVRYMEGKRMLQEQVGEFLSYDGLNDVFIATNSSSGKHVPGGGRVTLTIEPQIDAKAEKNK